MVTIIPRVVVISGENRPSPVPAMRPASAAQRTALSYQAPDTTSTKKGSAPGLVKYATTLSPESSHVLAALHSAAPASAFTLRV